MEAAGHYQTNAKCSAHCVHQSSFALCSGGEIGNDLTAQCSQNLKHVDARVFASGLIDSAPNTGVTLPLVMILSCSASGNRGFESAVTNRRLALLNIHADSVGVDCEESGRLCDRWAMDI